MKKQDNDMLWFYKYSETDIGEAEKNENEENEIIGYRWL